MITTMTINDYEALFVMWKNTPDMGLRTAVGGPHAGMPECDGDKRAGKAVLDKKRLGKERFSGILQQGDNGL